MSGPVSTGMGDRVWVDLGHDKTEMQSGIRASEEVRLESTSEDRQRW